MVIFGAAGDLTKRKLLRGVVQPRVRRSAAGSLRGRGGRPRAIIPEEEFRDKMMADVRELNACARRRGDRGVDGEAPVLRPR